MRQAILLLAIILTVSTVAFGQNQPSRATAAADQSIRSACGATIWSLATERRLADTATRLAIAAAAMQEPQLPPPQKKMNSVPLLVAGMVAAAATAGLVYWMATCDASESNTCSNAKNPETWALPLVTGGVAGAMIWDGAKRVEKRPAASVAFRVRF